MRTKLWRAPYFQYGGVGSNPAVRSSTGRPRPPHAHASEAGGSGPSCDLTPPPEIDRIHGVAPVTLVVAGGGAYADLAKAPVEDVGSVAAAVHPAPEGVARAGVPAGPPAMFSP